MNSFVCGQIAFVKANAPIPLVVFDSLNSEGPTLVWRQYITIEAIQGQISLLGASIELRSKGKKEEKGDSREHAFYSKELEVFSWNLKSSPSITAKLYF